MDKIKVNSIKIDATINLSADDWQFYSDMPGRDEAAAKLNRDIEQALANDGTNLVGIDWYSVLGPYSKFGATDTEGWYVMRRVLINVGLDGDRII